MILVGQYDSPYVRRVAVSLRALGFAYQHDTRSVFGDFDAMRQTNPLARIPSLVLDDGETLIDSAAILDWLDETAGPARALVPPAGPARRQALRRIVLATGVIDKAGAVVYERLIRPAAYRWPDWIARCLTQATGALETLAAAPWPADAPLDQPQITMACVLRWLQIGIPEMIPPGRYPALDALAARCEARPEFAATFPADYSVPRSD
jgi:glutathione S-transferase